jgi:hypothetical protein
VIPRLLLLTVFCCCRRLCVLQLCLEFMANHISPESEQFQDFVKHGEASRYRDMFVRWEDVWPEGARTCNPELEEVQPQV